MKLENKNNIDNITIFIELKNYCPLGKGWYTNQFKITMSPTTYIPDYCDIDAYVNDVIKEKPLTIEDGVGLLFDYLLNEYQPSALSVESHVLDAVHSEVVVSKTL